MTLAWGAKARGCRRHLGSIFFRPLRVKGVFCALTSRAALLFRGNTMGSPADRHRGTKAETRGLSWHPSGPLTPVDALDAGRADAPRLRRPPPRPAAHHPACSPPRRLWPRRHPIQQDLSQRPHMVGQSRRHRRRPRPPHLGRAWTLDGHRLPQRLAYTGMRQAKIRVHVVQGQRLAHAVLIVA